MKVFNSIFIVVSIMVALIASSSATGVGASKFSGGHSRTIIIRWTENQTPQDAALFVKALGLKLVRQLRSDSAGRTFLYEVPSNTDLYNAQVADLAALLNTKAEYVEDNSVPPNELETSVRSSCKKYKSSGASNSAMQSQDPELIEQWHHNIVQTQEAWNQGIFGKDTLLQIIDGGTFIRALDLDERYDINKCWNPQDGIGGDPTPFDCLSGCSHGTVTSTLSLGSANSWCGRGMAPEATLGAYYMIGTRVTSADFAEAYYDEFDVSSNSYGVKTCTDTGCTIVTSDTTAAERQAFADAVVKLRNGKGKLFVFSAGNDGHYLGSPNYRSRNNLREIMTVGATGKTSVHSFYSNYGPAVFIAAPGGDTRQNSTYGGMYTSFMDEKDDDKNVCQSAGQGTSYATPLVAGAVNLLLDARPDLTWRDVQNILAKSASRNDPNSNLWVRNAAGMYFNDYYGFGMLNIPNMLAMAKTWTLVPPANYLPFKGSTNPIQRSNTIVEFTCSVPTNINITSLEQVILNLDGVFNTRGGYVISIRSPSGTTFTPFRTRLDPGTTYSKYSTLINGFWGEKASGTWTMIVEKNSQFSPAKSMNLYGWTLNLYGVDS